VMASPRTRRVSSIVAISRISLSTHVMVVPRNRLLLPILAPRRTLPTARSRATVYLQIVPPRGGILSLEIVSAKGAIVHSTTIPAPSAPTVRISLAVAPVVMRRHLRQPLSCHSMVMARLQVSRLVHGRQSCLVSSVSCGVCT